MSPSSRRAWIEICKCIFLVNALSSPSSRRAWIEIAIIGTVDFRQSVALLAEGVDRNSNDYITKTDGSCRPPRGGRG